MSPANIAMHYVNILLIIIKTTYSQSDDSYDQSQSQEDDDYDEPKTHYHRLRHHRKPKYSATNVMPYVNGYDYPYSEDDCDCSCNKCDIVKPCCRDFCMHCQAMSQPNMYYVPYAIPQYPVAPYSILMPNSTNSVDHITTTQTTTTQSVTTTTTTPTPPSSSKMFPIVIISATTQPTPPDARREAVIEVSDIYINDNLNRNDAKYILTSLRRTKPYWQANGVVPIPNNLAEKLITQMKDDNKQNRRVFRSYQPS